MKTSVQANFLVFYVYVEAITGAGETTAEHKRELNGRLMIPAT